LFQHINHKWTITVCLILYTCLQSYSIHQLSINYDESSFANYGATLLKLQREKDVHKFESKLPITALNMVPRAIEQLLHPGLSKSDNMQDIIMGRYISLITTILLALIIYRWTNRLYGKKGALFSLIVFLLCPNFLAHGIFVSSDIFACLFMTGAFYFLWEFSRTRKMKYFVFLSLSMGLAEISKFSMVHLFILIPMLFVADNLFQKKAERNQKHSLKQIILLLIIFVGVNWFVISAAHLFYNMFVPLNDYKFDSPVFQKIQSLLRPIGNYFFVPLPSSYVQSMDAVVSIDHLGGIAGGQNGPPYLLGRSQAHGFWYYYFVVLFYKLPISTLLLLLITILFYIKKFNWKRFLHYEMYLIVPSLYFLIYMDFFYSTQVGIRHILIIMPLLYIFSGFFIQHAQRSKKIYFAYILVLYQFTSVAFYFPHFLPYTNELITNKKLAYRKIADTNLCYGEGVKFLVQYLRKNKNAKFLPNRIESGKIIMEVNEMLNLNINTMGKYDWVRSLEPADHIHSQYLIYEISDQQADSLKKKYPR
jgi:hypothetical protein